ncbi:purine nucleoside transporter PunC [Algicola sagamiensis]|uniref:purine nucleoside transporter PunC n=1 Tax=Algicola sagamiensis TaxID=163869 RepID=UPI00037FEAC4|nr:purine nucleoside transporter PunC [Algicola sagamiensis]
MTKAKPLTFFWLMGLSMLGFLATDMYLPAYESMRVYFGTQENLISASMSIFLLGMAFGQLIYGPVSDRFGRIVALKFGLTLFIIASAACALSTSIEFLLISRFFQALGACSAAVIWQAIIIDRYPGEKGQRLFATLMPLVSLSPALAPILGAVIEQQVGWQVIFWVLLGIALLLLALTFRETESAPVQENPEKITRQLKLHLKGILSSKNFIGNLLIFAACSSAFFAWLTGSPFMMTKLGYSAQDIGLSFIPQTIAFLVGGFGCRLLLERFTAQQLLPWGLALFVTSIAVISSTALIVELTSIWPLLIPFCFLAVANGAIYPLVINSALSEFKHCGATASGLLNFLQTLLCFLASSIVSMFAEQAIISVAWVMLGQVAIIGIACVFLYARNTQSLVATTDASH